MTAREQHTPGPWTIFSVWAGSIIDGPDGMPVASVAFDCRRDSHEANARLISAAPDLLAACEAMLSNLDAGRSVLAWADAEPDVGGQPGNVDAMRAAIRKARG